MAATASVTCPKCQGPMWDETQSKFYDPSKNRPIAKCKDKACGGAVWPPKNGKPPVQQRAPEFTSPGAPQGFLADQEAHEAATVAAIQHGATNKLQAVFALYDVCLDHAAEVAAQTKLPAECVPQMAATLFIQASQRGIAA